MKIEQLYNNYATRSKWNFKGYPIKDGNQKLLIVMMFIFVGLTILLDCKKQNLDKPNILWITIEDTSPQFLGCYGNEKARTPVIDQLAKKGIRFTNVFSTGTVCSPSRTAIITGLKTYETGTGHHRSDIRLPDNFRGFPAYMKEVGYYTTNNKKTDYNIFEEQVFIEETWDESSDTAGWWNRNDEQPFFSVFNFMDSHQSRTMTESYEWYQDNVYNQLEANEIINDNDFELPPIYNDSPEMRKQFARVYNSLKLTDNKIGELVSRLKRDGLWDDTIIFLFADHGEGMPRGKTNGIGYGYKVPFIVYCPQKYKELFPWKSGSSVDELIDFTDLAPTMLSISGAKVPNYMSGRVFMGERRALPKQYLHFSSDRSDNGIDMVRTVTDGRYLYSRNFMPFMPELRYIRYMEISEIKQQMRADHKSNLLDPVQKKLFSQRSPEVLYDLHADQWEIENLADNPEYYAVKAKLKAKLNDEVIVSKDIMIVPEYELIKINDTISPYTFKESKNYPLVKIYQAASLSGFRGSEIIKEQLTFLGDENKLIRYWAILGLWSQNDSLLREYEHELNKAKQDDYQPVSVLASALNYRIYGDKNSEKLLKEYCNSSNMQLALLAVNSLLYIDDKSPFIETVKNVRQENENTYDVKAACADFLGSLNLIPNNTDYRK